MRNLVFFIHASLDGFAATPEDAIDWISVEDDMFELAGMQTDRSDTAIYGRRTFEVMEAYWPTAGDMPDASKHDIQHSAWYKKVEKIVISATLKNVNSANTRIIKDNILQEIRTLKLREGKDIVLFGSPSIGTWLMTENLVDDLWIFLNPILLGKGIPILKGIKQITMLKLESGNIFKSGVVCMHYRLKSDSY